jgi:hypothetical protein
MKTVEFKCERCGQVLQGKLEDAETAYTCHVCHHQAVPRDWRTLPEHVPPILRPVTLADKAGFVQIAANLGFLGASVAALVAACNSKDGGVWIPAAAAAGALLWLGIGLTVTSQLLHIRARLEDR